MPIRFPCSHCGQLLGIASRKVGSAINCPKCGSVQTVPTPEAAEAALAMRRFARSAVQFESASTVVVYEDQPAPGTLDPPGAALAGGSAVQTPAHPRAEVPAAGEPLPADMILFPRRTFYIHGVLFILLFATGLGAGYLIGRGNRQFAQQVMTEQQARERVLVEGKLLYEPGTGQPAGDENSLVIALPEGKRPERLLSVQGIRAQDPAPPPSHRTLQAIKELGGAYARADADGAFSLVLPEGEYYLLIVSAHVTRPSQEPIGEADMLQMGEYFQLVEHLIGPYKYRWGREKVVQGFNPIEINFSADDES